MHIQNFEEIVCCFFSPGRFARLSWVDNGKSFVDRKKSHILSAYRMYAGNEVWAICQYYFLLSIYSLETIKLRRTDSRIGHYSHYWIIISSYAE